jgi:hypothetical protein
MKLEQGGEKKKQKREIGRKARHTPRKRKIFLAWGYCFTPLHTLA